MSESEDESDKDAQAGNSMELPMQAGRSQAKPQPRTNGVVSADDYASVQAKFGNVQQVGGGSMDIYSVPEPATMAVLLAGGAIVGLRRRHA